ncbi:MAG: class I SAM-dependent methyltransferase [Imperialibacter sp.]|uniref:class I SAM-dependent methyltransferase n=1 Tax=Imperialibacter sp. TaxID=2038411 RepID=UPI0032EB8CEC
MAVYTTEITSAEILSDNPIHQRLLKPYIVAKDYVKGNMLELGCGEGRGVKELMPLVEKYTALDKIGEIVEKLQRENPKGDFRQAVFPPFSGLEDNAFDSIVTFQVIEHITDDELFLKEMARVLKPGGVALLTTPNIKLTLTRNPWHIREYTAQELTDLAKKYFPNVEMKGIAGGEKVMDYHDKNRASVKRITRFDVLNLQYRLPAWMLRIPYDLLNRFNRNNLQKASDSLVSSISHDDYLVSDNADTSLDLFLILRK